MTQCNKGIGIDFKGKDKKKCIINEQKAMEIMIKGYQEMAEINLNISKLCFEVESEADSICIRLTECE